LIHQLESSRARPSGVVVSHPMQRAGVLDPPEMKMEVGFVHLCDTLNFPITFLQDVPGLTEVPAVYIELKPGGDRTGPRGTDWLLCRSDRHLRVAQHTHGGLALTVMPRARCQKSPIPAALVRCGFSTYMSVFASAAIPIGKTRGLKRELGQSPDTHVKAKLRPRLAPRLQPAPTLRRSRDRLQ
jgi:hypothetical protein